MPENELEGRGDEQRTTLCTSRFRNGLAALISMYLSDWISARILSSAPSILTALNEDSIWDVGLIRVCMAANQACCLGPAILESFNVRPVQTISSPISQVAMLG